MEKDKLPPGFELRPANWSDLEAVADVIFAACQADGYASMAPSSMELAQEWKTPGFTLETDAWVVTNPDGNVIGYEELVDRFAHASLRGDGYVHPGYLGLGVGTRLLDELQARAHREVPHAAPDLRVFIRNAMGSREKSAHAIHTAAGFKAIRYTWQMEIRLDAVRRP